MSSIGIVRTKVTIYYESFYTYGGRRRRRLLEAAAEDDDTFELSDFLSFELQRGSEDSADIEDLAFKVKSKEVRDDMLYFDFEFEKPEKVSTGERKDVMVVTIMDDSFFTSQSSGKSLTKGSQIVNVLPKMLPSVEYTEALEITQSTFTTATQTFIILEICIAIVVAVSLKAMWNLMNVLQVLTYIRFYTGWPIMMMLVLENMDNAITLKPLSDLAYEYGKSQF